MRKTLHVHRLSWFWLVAVTALWAACSNNGNGGKTAATVPQPRMFTYTIVGTFPHDPAAFTQGLVFADGVLYEGTGLRGRSTLRRTDLSTGAVLQSVPLAPELFGEGIAVVDNTIFQLTWRGRVGFVYDKATLGFQRHVTYATEGWGLTYDGTRLVMSDGTSTLYFRDPDTFAILGQVTVQDTEGPVTQLNELEYIRGEVYANVWRTDRIARIDPQTGHVVGWIDLRGLLSPEDRLQPVDVLNGIAYDAEQDRLFVTGKLWPKIFEIRLVPLPAS
jgi:glutamine cyclotransferase